ncbi:hypothetical protein VR44_14925 [Streptomyces katrae]|uniref:Uncharacterized protein n=1 Tax=Streptomyces katrae TaxID=68223 RepID=A0A0F4JGK0_9ACTN|nr:hypothetical protein VR44_14925 [Streptomyces katrae]
MTVTVSGRVFRKTPTTLSPSVSSARPLWTTPVVTASPPPSRAMTLRWAASRTVRSGTPHAAARVVSRACSSSGRGARYQDIRAGPPAAAGRASLVAGASAALPVQKARCPGSASAARSRATKEANRERGPACGEGPSAGVRAASASV